ncbi:MAG TPA: helix-hairpin-helix domain-containing protein [Bacteroidales bacterium]|nr:helix-hairpin-helix domain-containing protein [Bacteroidales bacterium]
MKKHYNHRIFSAFSAIFSAFSAFKRILAIGLLLSSYSIFAQEKQVSDIITSIAEELASDESDPETLQMYIDRLSELAEDPVNLNSASADELAGLFFLTDFQIKSLAEYIHSTGKILSVYEIANVTGFDRQTAEMLIPFIIIKEESLPRKSASSFRSTILSNVTYNTSSRDSSFSGSPVKYLTKYRLSSSGFAGGFTIEKDPGEEFLTGRPPKPDFFSAYMSYSGHGFVKTIIVGDYSAGFGQGSCINTGWKSGLYLTSPGYMSSESGIKPYTSTDENSYFRGIAASFGTGRFSLSLFYSVNKLDATLDDTGENVERFYTSGLHNTPALELRKDVLTDISYGANIICDFEKVRTGFALTEDRLSVPFIKDVDPGHVFDFTGKRNSLFSFYYNSVLGKMSLYGETTLNSSSGYAIIQGISLKPSGRLTLNFLYRNFESSFISLHGKGPGGKSGNEEGLTGNFSFEASKHLFILSGCEFVRYPWLRYRNSSPSSKVRQEIRVSYLPLENLSAEIRYNHSITMTDEQEGQGIPLQNSNISDYVRTTFRYAPVGNLTFTTKIDYKRSLSENGMLISQDAEYKLQKIPLTFWFRYCLFSTEGWNSRLYVYENDILYSMSIPALSGEGSRNYLMLKYEVKDFADIRFKYGITSCRDTENKEDFRFQVRLFF